MPYDKKTNQYLIKKSSFFRNTAFSQKKCAPMQRFINQMSKNGMHLERMGKFKCVFSENAGVRYVYSLCGEGGSTLYTESGDWEHFLTYKSVMFFRRAVPADAVKIERKFKKGQSGLERNWLNARLGEGLYLIGKVENEYIFGRSDEYRTYEYQIRTPSSPKKNPKKAVDPADTLKDIKGLKFITVSSDGSCYYFLKDAKIKNRFAEWRGKRITDMLLSASLTVLSLIAFIAFSALTVYGAVADKTLFTALGGAGLVASLVGFVVFFRKTQKISEARRVYLEEERARLEAESRAKESEEKPKAADTTNNNTVVMNTVVLNKYGVDVKRGRTPVGDIQYDTGFDSVGQLFDQTSEPTLDPNVNPAIAASKDPLKLAAALMQNAAPPEGKTVYVEQSDDNDTENEDAIYDGAFSKKPRRAVAPEPYGETETDGDEYDDGEEYGDGDYYERPTLWYLLYGLVTAAGIALAVLAVYLLTLFFTGGNGLFMAVAIVSLVFSPFLIKFGITNIRYLSEWDDGDGLDGDGEE